MRKSICIAMMTMLLAGCSSNIPFEKQILSYEGNKVTQTFVFDNSSLTADGAGQWDVAVQKNKISSEATDYELTFTMKEGKMASGGAAVQFKFDNWNTENYIFAPCYLYNGNRYRVYPIGYPPFIYDEKDRPRDMPITITNVPHFNQDGSDATVDFRTSNCATPLAGIYDKAAKRGFFLLTTQDTILGDNAFFISECPSQNSLSIRLSAPGVREHRYVLCNSNNPSNDEGMALKAGDDIKMHFRVYDFQCENLMAYFDKFLTIRKDLSGQNEYRNLEPFSSIASTIFLHHFNDKWYEDESFGYVANSPKSGSRFGHLSVGWNGVPAFEYALSSKDCPQLEEVLRRFERNIESIKYLQRESGLFCPYMRAGEVFGDGFKDAAIHQDVSGIRRQASAVYLGLRCLDLLKKHNLGDRIKPEWEEMIHKTADGIYNIYENNGEFGQIINVTTGEILTPNSTAGARCISALAYASRYFENPKYLEVAKKAGQHYYDLHLSNGYVGGAPAETLQVPDSEASADLLDAYVSLYEITRDEKWLKTACNAAAYLSSWVVSYDFKFPENTDMARVGTKATGSVWASVQNEHSAPGLYVMSGDFLFKLFRSTGDERYFELGKDIVHNAVQYVNTEKNKLQDYGGPGYVTERVNISDWEGNRRLGWFEDNDSNIDWEQMTLFKCLENPGIYIQPDKDAIYVYDHVNAKIISSDDSTVTIEIENPTYRDGDISVLAETSEFARENSLGWNAFYSWQKVHVPSGEKVVVTLNVSR